MNYKILKPSICVLLLLFIGAGCEKESFEIADESIVVDNRPGFSIYKTSHNYFNYVSIKLTDDGQPNAIPGYTLDDSRIKVDSNGNITPNFRWRLKSGYIVDKETYFDGVFTNITIQEYVEYTTKNIGGWPDDLLLHRIKDKDPFTEFYYTGCLNCPLKEFTLGEINEMLENGTIEEHFTRLK
ncbi:MAG: hypothetical protein JXR31_10855 [Prolixibacteraceae bacterium]|nr:hypothetical protein [Prolixibacteraceae bacterium]MBN2774740.1 hypothetical protein [Prolixibacteraceae bacterium]